MSKIEIIDEWNDIESWIIEEKMVENELEEIESESVKKKGGEDEGKFVIEILKDLRCRNEMKRYESGIVGKKDIDKIWKERILKLIKRRKDGKDNKRKGGWKEKKIGKDVIKRIEDNKGKKKKEWRDEIDVKRRMKIFIVIIKRGEKIVEKVGGGKIIYRNWENIEDVK